MLKSMGIESALAGHSERRTINGESDEEINKQCLKLIEQGMDVVLCIGETLEEYEKGLVGAVCEVQLKKNLEGVSAEDMKKVTIAYEVSCRHLSLLHLAMFCNSQQFCYFRSSHTIFYLTSIHCSPFAACLGHWYRQGCNTRDRAICARDLQSNRRRYVW